MLRLLDSQHLFVNVEKEIIVKDSYLDEEPIAYLVILRQPIVTLSNILADGWIGKKILDTPSREKLLFYLIQTMAVVASLHLQKLCSNNSITIDNLHIDVKTLKLKFSS